MADGGVRNPPSRGAVCEQHKHGSVGAGAGNRPGYPTDRVGRSRSLDRSSQAAVRPVLPPTRAAAVCQAWRLRSEVEVLTWGPDRGNPTSMRQGRGPEFTGRSQCGWLRCGASVRAGLKEAIDVSWSRTRVKRRKASFGGVSWRVAAKPRFLLVPGAYWRRDRCEISASYLERSAGLRRQRR